MPQLTKLGVVVPGGEGGRDAVAGEGLVELQPRRRQPGVGAAEERRVRGEGGDLGKVRADGVVDGQRARRPVDRDVDVHAGGHALADAPRVVGGDEPVALAVGDVDRLASNSGGRLPRRCARSLRAGRRRTARAARSSRQASDTVTQGGVTTSSWALRSSHVKRSSSSRRRAPFDLVGRLERRRVEEEQLLLEADRQRHSVRERAAAVLGDVPCGVRPSWERVRSRSAPARRALPGAAACRSPENRPPGSGRQPAQDRLVERSMDTEHAASGSPLGASWSRVCLLRFRGPSPEAAARVLESLREPVEQQDRLVVDLPRPAQVENELARAACDARRRALRRRRRREAAGRRRCAQPAGSAGRSRIVRNVRRVRERCSLQSQPPVRIV